MYYGKNTGVKEAKEELKSVSGDYEIRRIAELRQKYIRDEKAALAYATEEGTRIGIEQGIKQGEKESKKEIAKKLLEKGMDIKEIVEVITLSYDEVSKLQ